MLSWSILQKNFDALAKKQKIALFFAAFALIYTLWSLTLYHPLINKRNELQIKFQTLQTNISQTRQKIQMILENVQKSEAYQLSHKKSFLNARAQALNKMFLSETQSYLPSANLAKLSSLIMKKTHGINILTLKTDAPILLTPQGPTEKYQLIQQNFSLKLTGNYLDIFTYLKSLEKLSDSIWWDYFSYQRSEPLGIASLKFHVLSVQDTETDKPAEPIQSHLSYGGALNYDVAE